ncbi:MAG: CaiB/BaiF CoA-transferase family protein, partial [Pseudomonadota bacterium]|nr:CaiB/BaiF CoA-transferase family protein [Pseudomonadota bacterium]
ALFLELAQTADVIVEAFRPGVVKRLGVDYDAVAAVNPRIVYASISAFGQTGPLVGRPAHDLAVEALVGLLSNNVDRDGRPGLPAMPAGDMLAAAYAVAGIAMALYRREQTGRGDYLDLAMMDSILFSMPNSMGAAFAEQRPPVPAEERIWGGNAFYRIYRCKDGLDLVLGGVEMKFVEALLGALERSDLVPLCRTPGSGQAPVVAFLEDTFASAPRAHWEAFLAPLDVCWAPVNDLRTALDEPQLAARGMVLKDEVGKEFLGAPLKFLEEPPAPKLKSPDHGGHSAELIRALGRSEAEVAALITDGVIGA